MRCKVGMLGGSARSLGRADTVGDLHNGWQHPMEEIFPDRRPPITTACFTADHHGLARRQGRLDDICFETDHLRSDTPWPYSEAWSRSSGPPRF